MTGVQTCALPILPVDDSYYLDSEAGMATQWIDTEINREALHTFLYGTSFAVIE